MPQGNARNRSRGRRHRNRRRAQRPVVDAESPRNDEREKKTEEIPENATRSDNNEEDSKTTDDSAPPVIARGDSQGREYCFRSDDRRRIEKIELRSSRPRITTVSSLPLEATIGHIAGVGILETGIGDEATKASTIVTISEPVEAIRPFGECARTKRRSYGESDDGRDEWTNRLEIREVSDSDAEVECGRPTIVEVESDVERESCGAQDLPEHHGESKPRNQIGQQQFAPQKKFAKSEAESSTLMWDTVMPREVERKLRNFIEGLQLPSFSEEVVEEDGRSEKKLSAGKSLEKVTSRRKTRRRAVSDPHFANSFLDIIQEEGERLSEDEAQHIRDFINEEISKYRREDRSSSAETNDAADPPEIGTTPEKRLCEITINIDASECDDVTCETRLRDATSGREEFAANSAENNAKSETNELVDARNSVSSDETDEFAGITTNERQTTTAIENFIEIDVPTNDVATGDVDEKKLTSGRPEDVNNNASVANLAAGNNDVNDATDKLLVKVGTMKESEGCNLPRRNPTEPHATDDREAARSSSGSSARERPPSPPKRSSSFGHAEPQRPPTPPEIDYISNGANVYRPLVAPADDNGQQREHHGPLPARETEATGERPPPRRPELPKGGPWKIERTIRENGSPSSPESSSIARPDDHASNRVERVGTASENVDAAGGGPSIASSGIRDGDRGVGTLASATSTEITCREEGKPATPVAPAAAHDRDASSSRQEGETEACPSAKGDCAASKAGKSANVRMAGQPRVESDPTSPADNKSTMLRGPADTRSGRKLGERQEKSTSSYRRERTVKSETSETRIIERREGSSSADQRDGPRNSKYSVWESRHEEETYEEKHDEEETRRGSSQQSDARNSSDDEASFQRTDLQGHDSSSSTASLSTVRHHPLEASLTDISAIVRETTDDDPPDESLKRKLTLLKNGGSAGEASGGSSPVPYSPVEDLCRVHEDAGAQGETSKDDASSPLAEPSPLRELCVRKILSLPFGPRVIGEIATPRFNIFESLRTLQRFVSNVPSRDNARLNTHGVIAERRPPRDLAGLTKAAPSEPSNDLENAVSGQLLPESVNIETRLSEASDTDRHWRGLSTSEDPRLLVCLSPSQQQATSVRTSADTLLDLHRKFLNRYSYREEQPQRVPMPQYRVQVHQSSSSTGDALPKAPEPPARALQRDGRSSNRLLEIIKEHSPGENPPRDGSLAADRRSKITSRTPTTGQGRLTNLSDWLNRCDCRRELFLARSEDGRDDKPRSRVTPRDQSTIATRCTCATHPPSNEAVDSTRPSASTAELFAPNSALDRSDAGKKTPPWRTAEHGKHVNPALIDDKLEVPPLPKRAVTVDRSCIDTTSIFDQSPPRSRLESRRAPETAEKLKHVAAAEIMDKLRRLQTEASRRQPDGERRPSLQDYFAQQLEYIELLEEQLKNVILAEEEERKAFEELQTHVRRTRHCDDVRGSPDIPEEEAPRKNRAANVARIIPVEVCDGRTTDGKCAENKQREEKQGNHFTFETFGRRRSEPEVQSQSWREKSRNVEKDRTETIDRAGSRQFHKRVHRENGVLEEESEESVERKESRVIIGDTRAKTCNKVDGERRGAETPNSVFSGKTAAVRKNVEPKRPSTLPSNGEAFRQRMYDEYVHKVLERQERKNHKVVKISSRENIRKVDGGDMSDMAKEFIAKARSRLSKFGIDLDESATELDEEEEGGRREDGAVIRAKCLIDGKELEDARKLPKHLREFLKISMMTDDGGELRRMDCCVARHFARLMPMTVAGCSKWLLPEDQAAPVTTTNNVASLTTPVDTWRVLSSLTMLMVLLL